MICNIVCLLSGITTYEYVRAHRVAQERQMQLIPENRRVAPSDQVLGNSEKRKSNVSGSSFSSGSRLQWDQLEKEHGGRSSCERFCLCLCRNSYCCKNKSNIHPFPKHNSDGSKAKSLMGFNKNLNNQYCVDENNKQMVSEPLGTTSVKPIVRLSEQSPHLIANKDILFSNEGRPSTNAPGDSAQNVVTSSSVPKLPNILTKSTGILQNSSRDSENSPHINGDASKHINSDDNDVKRNLELLESNIKSVEDQGSRTNGKRPHYRPNGINRYNHIPWSHYHDDHDAIFVIDA